VPSWSTTLVATASDALARHAAARAPAGIELRGWVGVLILPGQNSPRYLSRLFRFWETSSDPSKTRAFRVYHARDAKKRLS
jgi:hypothetical protein